MVKPFDRSETITVIGIGIGVLTSILTSFSANYYAVTPENEKLLARKKLIRGLKATFGVVLATGCIVPYLLEINDKNTKIAECPSSSQCPSSSPKPSGEPEVIEPKNKKQFNFSNQSPLTPRQKETRLSNDVKPSGESVVVDDVKPTEPQVVGDNGVRPSQNQRTPRKDILIPQREGGIPGLSKPVTVPPPDIKAASHQRILNAPIAEHPSSTGKIVNPSQSEEHSGFRRKYTQTQVLENGSSGENQTKPLYERVATPDAPVAEHPSSTGKIVNPSQHEEHSGFRKRYTKTIQQSN